MKRIYKAYKDLIQIIYSESPFIVISTIFASIIMGVIYSVAIWNNSQIFNVGLSVAEGKVTFESYLPYLIGFVILSLLPIVVGDLFIASYVEPQSQLILRTAYKGRMLQKLKTLKYEHLENSVSLEIIDKAYNRAENSARHMFPMYISGAIRSWIAVAGTLYLFASVQWWLILTLLAPFLLETHIKRKHNENIYEEMEKYWKRQRSYSILGNMLRNRDFIKENKLTQSSDFLVNIYRTRLRERNHEYEKYYFKHLKTYFTGVHITKIAQIINALLLLWLYYSGKLDIGSLISLTFVVFTSLYGWDGLLGCMSIFTYSGYHINFFDYYDQYFALSEETQGDIDELPVDFTIEFDNVYFKYPGTEEQILDGLNLTVHNGEKLSVVGKNGEGKSTMIKLLLGLFQPDAGEIRIGGKPLMSYTRRVRTKLFGPVFQDFIRYSMTLKENVGVGDVHHINDMDKITSAMKKVKVDSLVQQLENGSETLLGRDFDGGVDLSGGQWQRIAIARAIMGDKPILLLDEPTSQLDPMIESEIYSDFAKLSENKTSIFITHRLGSTVITDRIAVIEKGKVVQNGTHEGLMAQEGLYADMFNSQKCWYVNQKGEEQDDE